MNNRQKEILQTYLDDELEMLAALKVIYKQASKDCADKIRELQQRTDLEHAQSIIWQVQYQQALKKQLDGIVDEMQTNEFASIADYIDNCYVKGYTGVMYDIQGQGIPIVVPIQQNQVVKAIQIDSKLSTSLYNRLGEDTKKLKKSIRTEVSRGIANGSTWNQVATLIAEGMNSPFNTALFNAQRIARTEGHRVQQEAAMDAHSVAKSKGADVVKQWDSTLDGRTRDSHARVDGEIRETDEKFSNGLMFPSDPSGAASEVVNCRCCLLTRARWALGKEELQTLKDRAAYFGLDKTDNFNDYQSKYMNATKYSDLWDDELRKSNSNLDYYTTKQGSNITAQQKNKDLMTASNAYKNLPAKVKSSLKNVVVELGNNANACDIQNKTIKVGIGATEAAVYHEYGHLIETYMMKKSDVDAYKKYLTQGLTIKNVKQKTYYNSVGNPVNIFVLDGANFETEYQSRLYISKISDAFDSNGNINTDAMLECVSEVFRKYMNNEPISDEARKLIESAVLL